MRALLASIAAALLFGPAANAALDRQIIGSEQNHSFVETSGCEHFYKTTFTSFSAQVTDQEERDIALPSNQLRILATEEGGVSIRGWNRPIARITICRSAVADSKQRARRVLDSITVSHRNGEIAAHGPPIDQTQAWWVNMIVHVPRRAAVDVRAAGGGVAIRNMAGDVTARATSGGVSVASSSGRYTIRTESGGITLDRISGRVEASSRDGTIALRLPPMAAPSLEARTDSGTILCHLKECDGGSLTPGRKALRLGAGPPDVRLSTTGATIIVSPVIY